MKEVLKRVLQTRSIKAEISVFYTGLEGEVQAIIIKQSLGGVKTYGCGAINLVIKSMFLYHYNTATAV